MEIRHDEQGHKIYGFGDLREKSTSEKVNAGRRDPGTEWIGTDPGRLDDEPVDLIHPDWIR